MSDVPRVSGKAAIAAFEKAGFDVVRVTGSHHIMKKRGHLHRLSIPVHAGKTVGEGLLKAQIKDAGLTIDEFRSYL
jgi:predicted RNA binding protein YcfA (HicA-like mRNA interferase family)